MKMKILYMALAAFIFTGLASCDEVVNYDKDPIYKASLKNDGDARIDRVTDITDREITIFSCHLDQYITLQGDNLLGTSRIVMNNQEIDMAEVSVKKHEIVFKVPEIMPPISDVDNRITVTTHSGDISVTIPLEIPDFEVVGIDCEFVYPNSDLLVKGKYFDIWVSEVYLNDTKVQFEADVNLLAVKIPSDLRDSQCTVSIVDQRGTRYNLPYRYNDPSGIIMGYEDGFEVSNMETRAVERWIRNGTNPTPILGTGYALATHFYNGVELEAWDVIYLGKLGLERDIFIDDDVFDNPQDYVVKWEYYALMDFTTYEFYLTLEPYNPWYQNVKMTRAFGNITTDGRWHTFVIPLAEFNPDPMGKSNNKEYFFGVHIKRTSSEPVGMCFDNFRIVPKEEMEIIEN